MQTVGVVGAGVIGACVAYSLARRGVHVHCVERGQPGGATTEASFARLSAFQQPTYPRFELSHTGMIEHVRFAGQFGSAPWWHPTGSLAWSDTDSGEPFAETVERLAAWGYRAEWHDAARVNREWEPGVAFPGDRTPVVRFPDEAWVDGPRLVSELIGAARRSGRLTMWNSAVEAVEVRGGRVVALRLADQDRVEVDAVVNAAGPEAGAVAATFGAPMVRGVATRASLVIDLVTGGDPVKHVLRGAEAHVRPAGPGRVRVRSEQVDARLPGGSRVEPGDEIVKDLLERAYRTVPALASSTVERVRVGTAVFPADGLPSVGALSGVSGYFEAFANSGVTLAPFIGRTLATQVVTGEIHPLWARCSPGRLRAPS
ncbi:MAG: FAD-binding oxidoreductase [Nonomuraea sp.]|nr:FAD-binding oxidoreductase [Nonomuraea sp.]NUP68579.1 FAD-binding oxidoreductase [Nonomuraea sp.]NUS05811.1 FAD-binding oxidoreductase [Nonomuraea sp.]